MGFSLDRLKVKYNIFSDEYNENKVLKKKNSYEKFTNRIKSLDFMRGLALILLVLAANHGYEEFASKTFSFTGGVGYKFIDFALPFMVLCMGAAIPVALTDRLKRYNRRNAFIKVVSRTVILYILGIILSMFLSVEGGSRVKGPLQVMAVLYFVTAMLFLVMKNLKVKDMVIRGVYLLLGIIVCLADMMIMSKHGYDINVSTSVIGSGDALRAMIGTQFMPSGAIAFFSAFSSVFFGAFIGTILVSRNNLGKKVVKDVNGKRKVVEARLRPKTKWQSINYVKRRFLNMLIASVVFFVIYFIAGFKIPVIPGYWTVTFVLISTAVFLLIFSFLYLFIDIVKWDRIFVFVTSFGANSSVIFILMVMIRFASRVMQRKSVYLSGSLNFDQYITYDFIAQSVGQNRASLIYSLIVLFCLMVIAKILYRMRKTIKL